MRSYRGPPASAILTLTAVRHPHPLLLLSALTAGGSCCSSADYMDDYWRMPHQPTIHWGNAPPDGFCSGFHAATQGGGPTEEEAHCVEDMGLTPQQVRADQF